MTICTECGFENPENHKFCQSCGADLPTISELESKLEIEEISSSSTATVESDPAISIENSEPVILSESTNKLENLDEKPPQEEDVTDPDLSTPIFTKLRYAGLSDVGKERNHNEDGFRCFSQFMITESHSQPEFQTHRGLFILCDGMGGHAGGEVASAMAIEAIAENFKPFWTSGLPSQAKIKEIIAIANQAIYNLNESELRKNAGRMGTTLVMVVVDGTEVAIAHVGDSRIYKISEDGVTQLTRDHEVAIKLIDEGMDAAIAYERYDAHQLTQALGPSSSQSLEPAIAFFSLESPALFLLCSDGLSDNDVVEQNWQQLSPLLVADSDLKTGVKNLVQLGNDLNGYDNISAVLVHCQIDVSS